MDAKLIGLGLLHEKEPRYEAIEQHYIAIAQSARAAPCACVVIGFILRNPFPIRLQADLRNSEVDFTELPSRLEKSPSRLHKTPSRLK